MRTEIHGRFDSAENVVHDEVEAARRDLRQAAEVCRSTLSPWHFLIPDCAPQNTEMKMHKRFDKVEERMAQVRHLCPFASCHHG